MLTADENPDMNLPMRMSLSTILMAFVAAIAALVIFYRSDEVQPSGLGGEASANAEVSAHPALVFTGTTFPSPTDMQPVFTINLDGSGRTQITTDGLQNFLTHFSPDGTKLLYTKFARGGYGSPDAVTDIFVYDRTTAIETNLTNTGTAIQGVWSPDGQRIAFGVYGNDALWLMNTDGSNPHAIARPHKAPDDIQWGDYLWSVDNWIYFTVAQNIDRCFKVRIDRIRPDGSERTQISDGGPHCTSAGLEQSGDAEPGISPDGQTLYSSRGLPQSVPGRPEMTLRHLYSFSTEPYVVGKVETDLSLLMLADCIAGVPKVSPQGDLIALFAFCPNDQQRAGIVLTDTSGTLLTYLAPGFAPDWNSAAFE